MTGIDCDIQNFKSTCPPQERLCSDHILTEIRRVIAKGKIGAGNSLPGEAHAMPERVEENGRALFRGSDKRRRSNA
ncbi:hypothetical protein [Methylocystis sp.]|uniref:hypothetical protein n=1 Tax=Methylocystis sp. TaxID=1911079 RepID=UPI003D102ADE